MYSRLAGFLTDKERMSRVTIRQAMNIGAPNRLFRFEGGADSTQGRLTLELPLRLCWQSVHPYILLAARPMDQRRAIERFTPLDGTRHRERSTATGRCWSRSSCVCYPLHV